MPLSRERVSAFLLLSFFALMLCCFSSVAIAQSPTIGQTVGVANAGSLWPGGVVYYDDGGCINNATCPTLAQAVSTFNTDFSGAVQWTERTTQATYVIITLSGTGGRGEVNTIGYPYTPGAVSMSCNTDCNIATLLHEMGHIVGLYHEQTRSDRDSHVTMHFENAIKSTWPGNFDINLQNQQLLSAYDFASVMQYPAFVDSSNGGPVIETIPPGIPLQGTEGVPGAGNQDYSAGDKESILRLYGHAPTTVTITSNPVGLQVAVDNTTYTTPQTFTWALNSTHTLSVADGVQTLTGDIENSAQPATFYYTYGTWSDSSQQSHSIAVTAGNGSPAFPTTAPAVATYTANFVQLVPYIEAAFPSGTGTVGASPLPQPHSGATGSFWVARQQATLTATPISGYNFYEFNAQAPYFWLPGGLSANPKIFYVPDTGNPVAVNAEFTTSPVYTVNVAPSAPINNLFSANLWAYVDGAFWPMPKNFSPDTSYDGSAWNAGSTHTLSLSFNGDTTYPAEYPYSSNTRYEFSSWSDSGPYSHTTAGIPAMSMSYTATVNPVYAPATNFGFPPCGGSASITTASTDEGYYPWNTQLSYSAIPGSGWTFAGWTYDLTGAANPASLTAKDETLVYANFNTTNSRLTVTSFSPGSVRAGSSSFTLTINGTGFTAGSLVSVNGTSVSPVTFVDSTQLQVTVSSSLVASTGNFDVFVENFPSGSSCAVFGYDTFVVTASTPSVTVTPSSSRITLAQSDPVMVTVSGSPTPTGSVTLSSGSYTSAPTILSAGSANITIPAGQLAVGIDTLTATYAPDSGSSFMYNSATGTSSVTVVNSSLPCVSPNPNPNPALTVRGDFNADCRSDLVWRNTSSGQVSIWLMNGTTLVSSASPGTIATAWVIQGVGDFNGDGKSDILWRNTSNGQVVIWLMNGTATASSANLGAVAAAWVIQGVGDFNGDGKSDILWRNTSTGQVSIWLMNGTTISSSGSPGTIAAAWAIQDVGDFNGDGESDILWRNTGTGQVSVWLMNGTAIASSGSPGTVAAVWAIQGVGDFNGDGKSDIVWRNTGSGQVSIWLMNGTAMTSSGSPATVAASWSIKSIGDLNGDGKSDIVWRNSNGQVSVWLMNGTATAGSGNLGTVAAAWQISAPSP